jgi:hypothetical protein
MTALAARCEVGGGARQHPVSTTAVRGVLFIPCSRRRACAAPNDIGGRAAGGDSRFSEMMELGRWGDERQRQVRGVADRSPGVAHGGGDTGERLCF